MLGRAFEDAARRVQAAAGEQQVSHGLPVLAPLLDLVEVAPVAWIGSSGRNASP